MTSTANRPARPAISIVVALAFFFSLWLLDFPKPMFDDLFYTGAALNMVEGGDFSNPLLARQGFPGHYFFVYPPLHSYVLFGWLKIFGVSAGSMTGFAMLMIVVTTLATIVVLRRHEAGIWLELAVPLGAAFALLELGLRPDTLGVALTMAGFAVADWRPKAGVPLACGLLLMFLGASAAPRVTLFAIALAVCVGYQAWRQCPIPREKLKMLALVICAALLTGLVFLCLIRFQLGPFMNTFRFHSTRFAKTGATMFSGFVSFATFELRTYNWPLVLIPIGLAIFLYRKAKNSLSTAGICTLATFLLAAVAGLLWLGGTWWPILAMLFLGGAALKMVSAHWRTSLTTVILTALLVANRRDFIGVAGVLGGKISADLGDERTAALAIHPSPEHALLIDCCVARYLYDYRLPEGALDLEFGAPFPGWLPGCTPLPPEKGPEFQEGDVYLACSPIVSHLVSFTYLQRDIPKWSPFGISRLALDKYPRHIYLIPAESCKGARAKPLT